MFESIDLTDKGGEVSMFADDVDLLVDLDFGRWLDFFRIRLHWTRLAFRRVPDHSISRGVASQGFLAKGFRGDYGVRQSVLRLFFEPRYLSFAERAFRTASGIP